MHTVCGVKRRFRKVDFFRLTGLTRPLPVRVPAVQLAGEEVRSWFSEDERWLLDEYTTDPMEEGRKRIVTKPLALRVCDCWLARGEECCCPGT